LRVSQLHHPQNLVLHQLNPHLGYNCKQSESSGHQHRHHCSVAGLHGRSRGRSGAWIGDGARRGWRKRRQHRSHAEVGVVRSELADFHRGGIGEVANSAAARCLKQRSCITCRADGLKVCTAILFVESWASGLDGAYFRGNARNESAPAGAKLVTCLRRSRLAGDIRSTDARAKGVPARGPGTAGTITFIEVVHGHAGAFQSSERSADEESSKDDCAHL